MILSLYPLEKRIEMRNKTRSAVLCRLVILGYDLLLGCIVLWQAPVCVAQGKLPKIRASQDTPLPLSRHPGDDFPLAPYLRQTPHLGKQQQLRVWSLLDQGHYNKAMALWEKSIQTLPTSQKPSAQLALAHQVLSFADDKRAYKLYQPLFISRFLQISWSAKVFMARHWLQNLRPQQAWDLLKSWPLLLPTSLRPFPSGSTSTSAQAYTQRQLREFWIAGHLLRAQAATESGHPQEARVSYQALRNTPIAIGDWLLYQQIQVLAREKNYPGVLRLANQWLRRYPNSRWRANVRLVQARALEQTGRCRQALPLYHALYRSSLSAIARPARLGHTRCLLLLQQTTRAYQQLRQMSQQYAGSWYAAQALQLWQQRFPRQDRMLLLYQKAYHAYRARDWERADSRFQTFIQRVDQQVRVYPNRRNKTRSRRRHQRKPRRQAKPSQPRLPLALYHRGQALFHRKQNLEAMRVLSRMTRQYPHHPSKRSARLLWIRAHYREVKTVQAIRYYEQFARTHAGSVLGEKALWWAAVLYAEHNAPRKSMALFQDYIRRYPESTRRHEARIKMALVSYQQGKYLDSVRLLQPILQTASRTKTRALFWTAKAYEQGKQTQKARAFLQKIRPLSDSYYAARAKERLDQQPLLATRPLPLYRFLSDDAQEKQYHTQVSHWMKQAFPETSWPVLMQRITEHPSYRRAYVFALAARWKEVRQEWNYLHSQLSHPVVKYVMARVWLAYGNPHRAMYWGQAFHNTLSTQQRRNFPTLALLRLTFPLPFPHLYTHYGAMNRVRPLLMVALTRQESLFHPQAVSGAGARGIAQIMPKEGQRLAQRWKLSNYQTKHLFRVALNLRMGATHFREYLDLHQNDVVLTLAAYNAGPHSLQRWLQQNPDLYRKDPEAFIEYGIGYRETRDYVRNCLRWYSVYRQAFSRRTGRRFLTDTP